MEEFHQSGLIAKDFCAERGMKTLMLSYWRNRVQGRGQAQPPQVGFTMLSLKREIGTYKPSFDSGLRMTVSGMSPQDMASLSLSPGGSWYDRIIGYPGGFFRSFAMRLV